MNQQKNIYFFSTLIITSINIVVTVILAVYVPNKAAAAFYGALSIHALNVSLSFWIVNSRKRTTKTKLTWLLVFLVLPIIGILIFGIWGRSPYHHRTKENYYDLEKDYINLYSYNLLNRLSFLENHLDKSDFLFLAMFNFNTCYEPVYTNSKIKVLKNGEDFFKNIFKYIDKAEKIICLQYYIFNEGFFLNLLIAKLLEKADQGIKVFILYDRFGCMGKFDHELIVKCMTHKNIEIAYFESLSDYKIRSTTNFRSHRKFLIIDNKYAIYGGSNIGDEYLSLGNKDPNWSDLNFKLEGPIVQRFLISFCSDWKTNSRQTFLWKFAILKHSTHLNDFFKFMIQLKRLFLTKSKRKITYLIEQKPAQDRDLFVYFKDDLKIFKTEDQDIAENDENVDLLSFINTGPVYYKSILTDQIVAAIARANKNIEIITPYLNPNDEIISALKAAAMSGVSVKIITPGVRNSQWYLLYMNRMNYWKLYDVNIDIYEYDGFIHSKLIAIDDNLSLIGTFNLDLRSLSSNFESMIVAYSKYLNQNLQEYFQSILQNAKKTSPEYLKERQSFLENFSIYLLRLIQPLL